MKRLYCYSKTEFDYLMSDFGYNRDIAILPESDNIAVISIGDYSLGQKNKRKNHYFDNPVANTPASILFQKFPTNILNIDFDDADPDDWHEGGLDLDTAKEEDFCFIGNDTQIQAMDFADANILVRFIVNNLGKDLYIHCSAGKSRSQAVVRFILDCFPDYDYQTRPDNPCLTPNIHVVRMLKRMYFRSIQ